MFFSFGVPCTQRPQFVVGFPFDILNQEDFMLPGDHAAVLGELSRRESVKARAVAKNQEPPTRGKRAKAKAETTDTKDTQKNKEKEKDKDDGGDTGKWQLMHQQLAESRSLLQLLHLNMPKESHTCYKYIHQSATCQCSVQ